MNMTSFLKSRKSTREFKKKNLTEKDLLKVKELIEKINEEIKEINMEVKLYEFGKRIYDSLKGVGGYAGVMIESPHYIALDLKAHGPEEKLNSGYHMEKMVTRLNDMGIGTCWVTINDLDMERMKAIFGEDTGENDYLLAIGYPKPKNPFIHEQFSERLGVEEIAFHETLSKPADMNFLEERGLGDIMFYVRFAPSSKNLQPWRFIIHDNHVELAIEEINNEFCYTDAGIAMYYFEELARTQGIKNKWAVNMEPVEVKGKKFMFIGKYVL
ncbi:nitroreductase family protein [Gudongella sp. SC589]|uniref:nitroreductase family protein n=1 Tax=Gudongella sp. SC589 TaxID=3385990 RepID=UPI003904D650